MKRSGARSPKILLLLASIFGGRAATTALTTATATTAFSFSSHTPITHFNVVSSTLQSMQTANDDKMEQPKKILWQGPLFGRLTKAAKQHLIHRKGWTEQQQPNDEHIDARLALIWPNKSGPQFEIDDKQAAHIRPYPKHITDILDDKVLLATILQHTTLIPKHITSIEDATPDKRYFVKHRYGAQGKSVYVCDRKELRDWWERTKNTNDFVVQEEVVPQTYEGRKFVMRSHILLWHSSIAESARANDVTFHLHLFDQVIMQHNATLYNAAHNNRAAHISQAGKKHPPPVLLQDLPSDHPAADVYPQLAGASERLVSVFEIWFKKRILERQGNFAPDTKCFALLGIDWLLQVPSKDEDSDTPQIKLCEVNSHPALGWGTMSKVPSNVFVDLVEETLDLLIDDKEYL